MANTKISEFAERSLASLREKAFHSGHANAVPMGPMGTLGNQGMQSPQLFTPREMEMMMRIERLETALGLLQNAMWFMQTTVMRVPQFNQPQFGFHSEPIQEQPALAARVPQGPIQVPTPVQEVKPEPAKPSFLDVAKSNWADVHDQNTEEFDRKSLAAKVENTVVAKPKADPARGRHKSSKVLSAEEKKEKKVLSKEKFRLSPEAAAAKKEQLRIRREEEGIKAAQNSYENLVGMSELEIESKSCDAQRVRELLIEYFKPCKGVVDEDMCAARFNTLINEILLRKQMEQVQAPTGNHLVDEANLNSKMNKIMHELDFWGFTLEGKKFYSNIIYQGPPEYIQIPIHGEEAKA